MWRIRKSFCKSTHSETVGTVTDGYVGDRELTGKIARLGVLTRIERDNM
jgi:hypothetical protein